jgi:uncharacterized protein (DUF736 family)
MLIFLHCVTAQVGVTCARAGFEGGHCRNGSGQIEENIMTAIGFVTRKGNSFIGTLETVSIDAKIRIEPNTSKKNDKHPDYRVMTKGFEIGAGWIKKGKESKKDYVSISLAAPEFGSKPIYCNLGKAAGQDDEDVFALIWNPAEE